MADAPIYQLSTEILREIFLWAQVAPSRLQYNLPYSRNGTGHDILFSFLNREDQKMRTEATTLDISQTCSYWRDIAISIPSLWSRISVDLHCNKPEFIDLLRLYIQRSSPALLTLKIQEKSRNFGLTSAHENAALVIQAVTEQKHRWREVDFGHTGLHTFRLFWNYFVQPTTDCLNLEIFHMPSITIGLPTSKNLKIQLRFRDLFGTTPKLHTLSSPSLFTFPPFFLETKPLNQVTTIKLTGGFGLFPDWCQFLQSYPNLQHLYLGHTIHRQEGKVSKAVNPIILPHLQSLDVDVVGSNRDFAISRIMSRTIRPLKAPSLSTLQLRGDVEMKKKKADNDTLPMLFSDVKGFLRESKCQLRQLQLSGDISTQMVTELLEQTQTLEELTVGGGFNRLPLFEALTVSPALGNPEFTILLPRLTKLEMGIMLELEDLETENLALGGNGSGSGLDDTIYAMVFSRRSRTGPIGSLLRSFRLSVPRPTVTTATESVTPSVGKWLSDFRSETLPRLRELTRYGLELELDVREA